jgi:hypothetical protein
MSDSDSPLPERFRPRPGVMSRELEGEAVLLDVESGAYFGLDAPGRRVWELLGEGRSLGEVNAALRSEFAAPAGRIESDVRDLVRDLVREGLLLPEE